MAVTDTTICNNALMKIGAQRILSLDDTSERAKILKEQYPLLRDELLYSHPWNFATARVELAALVTTPIYEWSNQFQLPEDCLRVYGTDPINLDFHVEGRLLLANTDSIKIKYIRKITDTAKFSPGFVESLSWKIAASVCYLITQNATLTETTEAKYDKYLKTARSFNGQESQGDRVYADSWLNSRA